MVNNMRRRINKDKLFDIIIGILMGIIALIFLLPLIHVLACSFSDADEVLSGNVGLFPVEFSLDGYKKVFEEDSLWRGFANSLLYTFIGTLIQVSLQMLCAYPLSRRDFKGRIWAIIIPGCVSVFNIIVIRTYIETSIPYELQEAARIDGCGDFGIFLRVILPLSRPIILVMILYAVVGYWNNYFNALLYIQDSSLYPLQRVLQDMLVNNSSSIGGDIDIASSEQLKYVTIVVSSIPLLVVYPFFQKYFEKGVVMGGVKG